MAESQNSSTAMPEIEVVVSEPRPIAESDQHDKECSLRNARDCLRLIEEHETGADMLDMIKRFGKEQGGLDIGVSALSSTATTVSSSMASQWINHMKKTFKRRAMVTGEDQQNQIYNLVKEASQELYQPNIPELHPRDILLLYSRGLEAHHDGRYREMFELMRPCLSFYNTNVLIWIRVSEALVYEFYEEVWEFDEIYGRVFHGATPNHKTSHTRKTNDERPRHKDMSLRFADISALMAYALARQSQNEQVLYAATVLYGFLLLKRHMYSDAIDVINYYFDKNEKPVEDEELGLLFIYKAEGKLGMGRYNRAIEYCLRVIERMKIVPRTKYRALMLMAIAYMRKCNFKKAYELVLEILKGDALDELMLENVALLGLNLAHLMGNKELFDRFTSLLQQIVF